ncbi:MAG: DUF502 domain-containing protein [Planctomycetes bacterium]|nr:DUF502 domain-containing protein [Planctomycetota bacterium]
MKKHLKIFVNGIVVVAPAIITIYAVVAGAVWLDSHIRLLLQHVWPSPFPGLGILLSVAGIYMVGLLARTWLLRLPLRAAESIVERIPLVKSLYSAIKDMLQFLGGGNAKSRGKPCMLKDPEGDLCMLGLVTQQDAERFLSESRDMVGVYLPMSYQLGGFTVYVPRERVEELKGVSVEQLLKLCLTAGVGSPEEQESLKEE